MLFLILYLKYEMLPHTQMTDGDETIGACLVPIISKLQDIFSSIGKSPIDLPQVNV